MSVLQAPCSSLLRPYSCRQASGAHATAPTRQPGRLAAAPPQQQRWQRRRLCPPCSAGRQQPQQHPEDDDGAPQGDSGLQESLVNQLAFEIGKKRVCAVCRAVSRWECAGRLLAALGLH